MKTLVRFLAVAAFALLGAPSPVSAEDFHPPEGHVAIHYHRADGSYDGWGLHTWESFQKKEEASDEFSQKQMSDRPLTGVNWFKPLAQTGKDDFGTYWVIPAKEYENGRVNYIIHKGDKKEQKNRDMYFMVPEGREIWVNSGDPAIYKTKDEAVKAQKK